MDDLIQWLFGSFWRWAGFTIWLMIVAQFVGVAINGSLIWLTRIFSRG